MKKRYNFLFAVAAICSFTDLKAQTEKKLSNNPISSTENKTTTSLKPSTIVVPPQKEGPSEEFKKKYLEQYQKNAILEAAVIAESLRKKYKGDANLAKFFEQMILDKKIAVEALLLEDKTPENSAKILNIIARTDSVLNRYSIASKNKELVNNTIVNSNNSTKFASAIRTRSELKLTKSQSDSLIYHANKLADLLIGGYTKAKDYEQKFLPLILNDAQYTNLLIIENKKQALAWAIGDWKELKQRALHQDLDSAKAVIQMFNYNLAVLVKKARFGDNVPQNSPSISSLATQQPEALKRVKQARLYNNPIPQKTEAKTKFTW